ncbi:MAG TPA: winged helix-turn-helix transcriptional regulator [Anaerolineales bacterium]|jgi:DNA-binding MarR family transcriptional regulator|nr:winged helix-turn-helix transcriptional regulator [Anaerolineales bacterium]
METSPDPNREMVLLEKIEYDPDITQANLAAQLGVAVGTVNWHLKRLVAKGYVKVKRAQRRKLRYMITPEGIAFRARLTVNYIEQSMQLYRLIRGRVLEAVKDIKMAGFDSVRIVGNGDIAEICRLTCIEQGLTLTDSTDVPLLELHDLKVILHLGDTPGQKVTLGERQDT